MQAKFLAAPLLAALLFPATAQALPSRIWVGVSGTDAPGCGPATNPCRSFQYAHDTIADGGEIDVGEPGGYGPLAITKSISIANDGVGTASIQAASGAGISINALGAVVTLRGLSIDGGTSGTNGVDFISGAVLTLRDCTVRHFHGSYPNGNGVYLHPNSGTTKFIVTGTTVSDNDGVGMLLRVLAGAVASSLTVDHVTASTNGGTGITAFIDSGTMATMNASVSNSLVAQNGQYGMLFNNYSGILTASVSTTVVTRNVFSGVYAGNTARLTLSGMNITFSGNYGLTNATSPNAVYSLGNNAISDNPSGDVSAAMLARPPL